MIVATVVTVVVGVVAALLTDLARRFGECRTRGEMPTVPGWMKRVCRHTIGQSSVTCSRTRCIKTFSTSAAYRRERDIYRMGLSYVPRLISWDDTTNTLVVERTGHAAGSVFDSSMYRNSQSLLVSFAARQIRA